jgi:signal transduction histidine kinase
MSTVMPVGTELEDRAGAKAEGFNWNAAETLVNELVHDLRQPLSEIESIAYYLEMAGANGAVRSREMLGKIQVLVAEADRLLTRAVHDVKRAAHPEAA